jgi:hypothetical protein
MEPPKESVRPARILTGTVATNFGEGLLEGAGSVGVLAAAVMILVGVVMLLWGLVAGTSIERRRRQD